MCLKTPINMIAYPAPRLQVSHPGGTRQGGRDGRIDESRDQGEACKSTEVDGEHSGMPAYR